MLPGEERLTIVMCTDGVLPNGLNVTKFSAMHEYATSLALQSSPA